jgi:hypothetical protein
MADERVHFRSLSYRTAVSASAEADEENLVLCGNNQFQLFSVTAPTTTVASH